MIRLADIDLYLGDFSSAQRYGHSALQLAIKSGSANLRARCLGMIAATEFFGGDLVSAHTRFTDALDLLEDLPEVERDRTVYTTVLGNVGNLAEAKKDWETAERYHREALRLRREVADARGVLQSLHAVAGTREALGDRDGCMEYLNEAEQLATDLDETPSHGRGLACIPRATTGGQQGSLTGTRGRSRSVIRTGEARESVRNFPPRPQRGQHPLPSVTVGGLLHTTVHCCIQRDAK